MNLGTTRLRCRPRKRWKNEVRMEEYLVENGGWKKYLAERNGRIVGGEWWMEKVPNREEWKNSWWRMVDVKSTYQIGMEE
jgi:hypothetical protein